MEGMSAFAGVYGREMRPQRRHMDIALFEAARSGNVEDFRSLLSAATPADHSTVEATTVVIDAEEESKLEMIFGVTVGGNTVLHIAAQHGHLDFAKEVCHREPSLVAAVNTRLETPLHCCSREGHEDIVSLIITTIANSCSDGGGGAYGLLDVLRARNVHGETALHEALRFGHELVAKKLIAADNELASFVSKGMSTTLSPAIMIKDAADKQLIYSVDYDAGSPFHVNDTSMSPLYLAVMTKSKSTVEALLQHDSSSFAGPGGRTALHAAVTRCQDITRMILKWKPVLGRVVDESHSTPLHYAAADGDREMVRILLEHDPSVVYISDKDDYFPIHVAAGMDHVNVVCEILNHCPDSFELVDHKGRSFLHVAAERCSLLVVELIVNQKKRDFEMLLNQRDNNGDTPLHLVVTSDNPNIRIMFDELIPLNNAIIPMNNLGLTPLDLSLESKSGMQSKHNAHEYVSEFLVKCGALISPRRLDHQIQWSNKAFNEETELKKATSMAKNLAFISVLIATVTFAAGFTIPGGYKSDDGTSIMAKKYPFKVFLISNAFALFLSLIATMQIIHSHLQRYHIYWSLEMLFNSFVCMCMSFGMATLVVMAPKDRGIGFLVCILSLVAPFCIGFVDWAFVNLDRLLILLESKVQRRSKVDPRAMYWLLHCERTAGEYSLLDKTDPCQLGTFKRLLFLYGIVFLLALL